MRTSDPREARLPKWAQAEMARLRAAADSADARVQAANDRAEFARLATDPEGSNTVFAEYGSPEVGLGNGVRVQFRMAGFDRDWRKYLDVRVQGDEIELHAGGGMSIRHNSSNLAYLTVCN